MKDISNVANVLCNVGSGLLILMGLPFLYNNVNVNQVEVSDVGRAIAGAILIFAGSLGFMLEVYIANKKK